MISKVKRRISLGKKVCVACGTEFQPNSGAQRTCSGACKERAKREGLTAKRGPNNRGGVDPALAPEASEPAAVQELSKAPRSRSEGKRLSEIDPGTSTKTMTPPPGPSATNGTIPDLELDLTPIEVYIKAQVAQEVQAALSRLNIDGVTRAQYSPEEIKKLANQVIEERLRGLLGR